MLHHKSGLSGIMLMQCLVYIPIMALIVYVAVDASVTLKDGTHSLQRGTMRLTQSMSAGERWREDIRSMTGKPTLKHEYEREVHTIPGVTNSVQWSLFEGKLWRRADESRAWAKMVDRVKSISIREDKREHVTAWVLDFELKPGHARAKLTPVYTFIAVPGHQEELK
ncbi:MAG: hypothetical protein CMO80_22970 [Verrucomicrobiales bacterium]|nr:hypothetical protein [Verrucomicrobiales bacterium]